MNPEMQVDVPPRISLNGADAILRGSPLEPYTAAIYDYAANAGIDPAYILAIARKETQLGREGVGRDPQRNAWALRDHSWGRGRDGPGGFSWYDSYLDAAKDVVDLLTDSGTRRGRALYFAAGLRTVEAITQVYAPPSENATAMYIRQIREVITAWTLAYPVDDAPPGGEDEGELIDQVAALKAEVAALASRVAHLEDARGIDSRGTPWGEAETSTPTVYTGTGGTVSFGAGVPT